MAYIDEGDGDAIVFQHGNATSSYLWRNVMPHLAGLGRLIACDLIGMGASDKLIPSGPDRYSYAEHQDYLFELWDQLDLGDNIVFVLHDWGSALGFNWSFQSPTRVQGIAYMEALVTPLEWTDFPEDVRPLFEAFRSPAGEQMVLGDNVFIEQVLFGTISRPLSDAEKRYYRQPYLNPGEDRRPTLSWPREIPISGEPPEMVELVARYGDWLAQSPIPKLFIRGVPGAIGAGRPAEIGRACPNQTEITVPGFHFLQEDAPAEIGTALAEFVRTLRSEC
jgi:haloalkane dehalogenase